MADLFGALTSATRALEAQRFGLDVTGHNIANVNTPGYARRVVDFRAVPPDTQFGAGNGVEVAGIRAQRDRLVERRLDLETMGAEREAATSDLLSLAEVAFGTTGQAIDSRLTEFFDSFSRLADAPTSAVARQEVVLQGSALAGAFRSTANRLEELRRDADRRITGTVGEINEIAERIAALNASFGGDPGSGIALHAEDEQARLVRQLATLTDITITDRPDGGIDVDVAGGRPLVVGNRGYSLVTTPTGPDGHVIVTGGDTDLTALISGGRLGGLIRARDVFIPSYLARLDEQAFTLANAVNTIHAAASDLNGNTGQAFFTYSTPPAGQVGAAEAIVVHSAVVADPSRVAAAQAALPLDNRAARDLSDLRHSLLLAGGTATMSDAWGQLTFRVGRDVQDARDESALRRQIAGQLETLRDQASAVSLDEEALLLMKFQRAYEANAKFFEVINGTLDELMNVVTR